MPGPRLDKVRLRFYCTGCCPGYHLPYFAAASTGLFAAHGLEVEFLEPLKDASVESVATGDCDFCLTSVLHLMREKAAKPQLAARFVAMVMSRSPISALVPEDSPVRRPEDLAGLRVAGSPGNHHVDDYRAAMVTLGIKPPKIVPTPYGQAPAALGRGEVDVVADFAELVPRTRRQAGIAVRPVRFHLDIYASGLVGADRLPADLVRRMRAAVVAALELQHRDPTAGLAAFSQRYPAVEPADALEGWALMEPGVFTGEELGSMDPHRWERTIAHVARTYGFALPAPETVYHPDYAGLAVPV